MADRFCGSCLHFIGAGDWNLCCALPPPESPYGFLCYEDTPACEQYETTQFCERVHALQKQSGCSIHSCREAIAYADAHEGCTAIGYLKAKVFAVNTKGMSLEERVRKFSETEEVE